MVATTGIADSVAFVAPAAKQTLLVFFDSAPVTFENVEQQAPTDLQSAFIVHIAPSAIAPVGVDYGVESTLQSTEGNAFPAVRSPAGI